MKKSRRTYNGVHLNKKSNTQDVVEQSLTLFQGEDQENLCRISERNAYRLFEKTITGKQNEDFYYQWGSRIP